MISKWTSTRVGSYSGLLLLFLAMFMVTGQAENLGTAFTYQGRLLLDGRPADGPFDLRFDLYDGASGGAALATVELAGQSVSNGLFTVPLDFGDIFAGEAFYLEVGVRPAGGAGGYTALVPRQSLAAPPYALYALGAPWSGLAGVPAGFADGVDDDTAYAAGAGLSLAGTTFSVSFGGSGAAGTAARSDHTHPGSDITSAVAAATTAASTPWSGLTGVPAGFADNTDNDTTYSAGMGLGLAGSTFSVNFAGSGAAASASRSDHNHSAAYWSLAGNAGTSPDTHFLGTTDNTSLYLKVNGAAALRLQPTIGSPYLIGGIAGNSVAEGVIGAVIAGGGNTSGPNVVTDGEYGTISGGYKNEVSGYGDSIGGGNWNTARGGFSCIPGGRVNTIDVSGRTSAIGGGEYNHSRSEGVVIAGGQHNSVNNDCLNSSIGGGEYNYISTYSERAVISGGYKNSVEEFGDHAVIGGGQENAIITVGNYATIGGGLSNRARNYGVVGGGRENLADGIYATVPGGYLNSASGDHSFAAGRRAKANHDGSFVLTDSTDADFASVRVDALRARFNGGLTFQVNDGYWFRIWYASNRLLEASNGAHLTAGGTWTNGSRRALKENFAPVDGEAVLEQVASLPVQRWNYIAEGPEVKHVGPTAEDFQAAFGLGGGDGIATVDADGVSLAAIQALLARQEKLMVQVQSLQERLLAMEDENAALARRLAEVEGLLPRKNPR